MNLLPALAHMYQRPVQPVSIVPLRGGASNRRYYRVTLPAGCKPETVIAMELSKADEKFPGRAPVALTFVNVARHLTEKGLRAPHIHLDAAQDGLILLEDLGDRTLGLELHGGSEQELRAWYCAAIDLLLAMHKSMWPIPAECVASHRVFDYALLRWELDHYREWGAEALQGKALDPAVRRELDLAFDDLAREVTDLPRGFVHRDFQSRNLMVLESEPLPSSLAIIDFQDAFQGPRVYDLVALLNDSYASLEEGLKQELFDRYGRGAGVDRRQLALEFHLVTVQRKLKDGGRFVFIDRVKGDPSFLPYIDGALRCARESLEHLTGHRALKLALEAADPDRFGSLK